MRSLPLALAVSLGIAVALPASADDAAVLPDVTDLTATEREAFGAEVRDYLLENPEVIMEAIQILEERRNQAAAVEDAELVAQHSQALFEDPHAWVGGNPEGDVTIVEFLDYRCGFCQRAHPIVKELVETDPGIRLIVKEFPILGPDSVAAGRMAMAALDLEPALYEALNDELMSYDGQLDEAAAYRIAGEIGYDIPALKQRAQSDEITARLGETYRLAQALGLQGTPSFVIGNEIVRGFLQMDDMRATVADARAASN